MFVIPPSPRQLTKINTVDNSLLKCPENWSDFAQLCQIRSGNRMVQFIPYEYQIKLIELMKLHPITVVVKSRQLGITQAILNRYLHKAILNPAYCGIGFMKSQADASNLSRRTRVMLDSLGKYAVTYKSKLAALCYSKIAERKVHALMTQLKTFCLMKPHLAPI
jgi:hypothetical protein